MQMFSRFLISTNLDNHLFQVQLPLHPLDQPLHPALPRLLLHQQHLHLRHLSFKLLPSGMETRFVLAKITRLVHITVIVIVNYMSAMN